MIKGLHTNSVFTNSVLSFTNSEYFCDKLSFYKKFVSAILVL